MLGYLAASALAEMACLHDTMLSLSLLLGRLSDPCMSHACLQLMQLERCRLSRRSPAPASDHAHVANFLYLRYAGSTSMSGQRS